MGLLFRSFPEEGHETLVGLLQGAERTLGQWMEAFVEVENEVRRFGRSPRMARRNRPSGRGSEEGAENEEEEQLTKKHGRRIEARLTDSAVGAEKNSLSPTQGGLQLAAAVGCAHWGELGGSVSTQAERSHEGHSHRHPRIPGRERGKEKRSLLLALAVTASIMLLEAIGGWISGSLALQADAGHMLTDSSSLLLSILAISFASRPADLRRTYGFYRAEILAALLNGALLLGVAALIFWEGITRLRSPEEIQLGTMLLVATIGLAANVTAIFLLHERSHGSLNVRGAYLHVIGDALSSVGVVVAGLVIYFTGWLYADAIVSMVIAVVIVWGAIRLLREATDVLLEAVPAHLDLAEILHAMEGAEGVERIHDLHVWTISSGMYALSAHVVVDSCDLGQNDAILRRLEDMLSSRFGLEHVTLQIETPAYCG